MTTSTRATASPSFRVLRAPARTSKGRNRDRRQNHRARNRPIHRECHPVARRPRLSFGRTALREPYDLRNQHTDHSTARKPRKHGETAYPKIVRPCVGCCLGRWTVAPTVTSHLSTQPGSVQPGRRRPAAATRSPRGTARRATEDRAPSPEGLARRARQMTSR